MSDVIAFYYTSGRRLAATLTDPVSGQIWRTTSSRFEVFDPLAPAQFAVPLLDNQSRCRYVADAPVMPGLREVEVCVFDLVGATWDPATDTPVAADRRGWDGQRWVGLSTLAARLGGPSGLRSVVLTPDGENLADYDVVVYDTNAHANTNDGTTGALETTHVEQLFDINGKLMETITTKAGAP